VARFSCQMPIWMTVFAAGTLLASSVQAQSAPPFQKARAGGYQFTKIRIKHYDAGAIADLITRPDGIIIVPPNFVLPAGAMVPQKVVPNALPEGVRRIFVLESDNSLVIEATPEGLASLTLALSLL
jgi:hypothetical protein